MKRNKKEWEAKNGNEEEWIEIQKKQRKLQVFFPYAIWVFKIFWQKNFLWVRLVRSSKAKKEPPYFVRWVSERKLYKNCPLKTFHFEFEESRLLTQIGNLKGKAFGAKKLHLKVFILASFWIAEGKQRNEAE